MTHAKCRVLFMGSPDFACPFLETLASSSDFELVCVVTPPDKPRGRRLEVVDGPVKAAAKRLELSVVSPVSVNAPEFVDELKSFRCDLGVVVAFGQILRQRVLDSFRLGMVNVHGSLLPRWRGAAPIQRALMAGDHKTGVSLQRVVRQLDAGPVLGQRTLSIENSMDSQWILDELSRRACEFVESELLEYVQGLREPQVQSQEGVTYAPKLEPGEEWIPWSSSAISVFNHVRAFACMGGSCTNWVNERIKIRKCTVYAGVLPELSVGEILVENRRLWVGTGEGGVVEVLELQRPGRRRQPTSEVLLSGKFKTGQFFLAS